MGGSLQSRLISLPRVRTLNLLEEKFTRLSVTATVCFGPQPALDTTVKGVVPSVDLRVRITDEVVSEGMGVESSVVACLSSLCVGRTSCHDNVSYPIFLQTIHAGLFIGSMQ